MSDQPIVELSGVSKRFPRRNVFGRHVDDFTAVDKVSLSIRRGEVYGLAGESGSGKSTIARMILGLTPPSEGRIRLDGEDVTRLSGSRSFGRKIQMVFQNPGSSLNPRRTVGQTLAVPLRAHGLARGRRRVRIEELLAMVQLPADFAGRFPHELSGGQKQRAAIARALAVEPEVIVLDEPTSALDVSVQAKVIGLLIELGQTLGLTFIFISHDLSLMRNFAQRVGVLYRGGLVESGPTETLFTHPQHAYTRLLLASVPVISAEEEAMRPPLPMIGGEVATADQLLTGLSSAPAAHSEGNSK